MALEPEMALKNESSSAREDGPFLAHLAAYVSQYFVGIVMPKAGK
jgi:hypothetical protein